MKKILAIFLMCIFAFAFTAVRATDTSPGHQKFSVEKTTLQAPACFASVNQQITEIPVFSFIYPDREESFSYLNDHKEIFTEMHRSTGLIYSNSLEKEKASEVYHSPGWLVQKYFKITSLNYQSKLYSPARIIPYSRDRS